METTTHRDSRKQRRQELADDYLNQDLSKQREWYDTRASSYKRWANCLSLIIIAGGALTAFVAALKPQGFDPYDAAVAALGVIVALAQGILRIWRYDETWIDYRIASERMLRERRLFINAAGSYANLTDEEKSFRHFIETIEQIIAVEQKSYFKHDDVMLQNGDEIQQDASAPPAESSSA